MDLPVLARHWPGISPVEAPDWRACTTARRSLVATAGSEHLLFLALWLAIETADRPGRKDAWTPEIN